MRDHLVQSPFRYINVMYDGVEAAKRGLEGATDETPGEDVCAFVIEAAVDSTFVCAAPFLVGRLAVPSIAG